MRSRRQNAAMTRISRPALFLLLLTLAGAVYAQGRPADGRTDRAVVLGVPVSGVIGELHVAPGDQVKRGQRLLALDPRPFRLRLRAVEATVARLRPERDERARELERAQELYDRTVLSDVELQHARNAAEMAAAAYEEAESARELAALELEYSVLRAPSDGTVVGVEAAVGQVVVNRCQAAPLVWFEPAGSR
jgi:multidrug efflux system membrane fusion protein